MQVFNQVDLSEWQEIADRCEYATFFHTPAWSKAFAETYPEMKIAAKKFVFDDRTRAILPLVKIKIVKGLLDSYISNAAGVYGGWISDKTLSAEQADKILKWISRHLKNLSWRINPFDPNLKNIAIPDTRPDFTQYLDLRNGFEPIYRSWTKGHASAVQQARREGITIREAVSIEEWKDYFVIYEDSLRRWGEKATNSYPFVLFENLFKNGCRNVKLWLACFENKPVSGALCFYNNHHVVWWHGASLENYFPKRPAHLLQYEIIKDACEKGYWWYDFNPSGGHEGVVKFKKGFGAEKIGSDVICISSFSFKLLNKIRKYLIKLIRKN